MIKIKLSYDPYHMTTSLNINGQNVKRVQRGYEKIHGFVKQSIPLQSWVDPIPFREWKGLLWEVIGNSGETKVEFHFRGREIDFKDFKESIERQSIDESKPYKVNVSFPNPRFAFNDAEILQKVDAAYALIQSPDFKKILDDKLLEVGPDSDLRRAYERLPEAYAEARDGEFRIVFSGMYTCGKSTIINAILGKNILPTRDGTCTSKVFKISHDAAVSFAKMSCVDEHGAVVVEEREYDEDALKKTFDRIFPRNENDTLLPSNPPTIATVLISTDMSRLYPEATSYNESTMNLVIIDTPGTSSGEGNMVENGQAHRDITKEVITSGKKEIVVLATSAIEDKDDSIQDYLDIVDESEPNGAYDQRFLFVLNKADACNLIRGETWEQKLRGIKNYYNGNKKRSIQNPRFFPTSALAALLVRTGQTKGDSGYGSIREKYYIADEENGGFFPSPTKQNYHFDEICSTSQAIKDKIAAEIAGLENSDLKPAEKRIKEIELHSGIVSLEMAIRDYIEKYAVPLKIQALLKTYKTIFDETKQLVTRTRDQAEKAAAAKKNAEDQKQQKERDQEEAQRTEESLKRIRSIIEGKEHRLDAIIEEFERSTVGSNTHIKSSMQVAIGEAGKRARAHAEESGVKEEIQKIIEEAANKIQKEINAQSAEGRKKAQDLEQEIKRFFSDIRSTIDFGNHFKIEYTTAFQGVNTKSILAIKNVEYEIRNPEYDSGWPIWRFFKRIWTPKTITREKINLDEIRNELWKIRAEFDQKVDAMTERAKNNLLNASEELKRNMRELERKITEYSQRLSRIKQNVERCSDDIAQMNAMQEEFQQYEHLLNLVAQYTDFGLSDEME